MKPTVCRCEDPIIRHHIGWPDDCARCGNRIHAPRVVAAPLIAGAMILAASAMAGGPQVSVDNATGKPAAQHYDGPQVSVSGYYEPKHLASRYGGPQVSVSGYYDPKRPASRYGGPQVIVGGYYDPKHPASRYGGPQVTVGDETRKPPRGGTLNLLLSWFGIGR